MELTYQDRYYATIVLTAANKAYKVRSSDMDSVAADVARAVLAAPPPPTDPVEIVACELSGWTLETLQKCDSKNKDEWLRVAKRAIELGAKPVEKKL